MHPSPTKPKPTGHFSRQVSNSQRVGHGRRMPTYTRLLSDNEASYFLPSRADGVNDMCLYHRLRADRTLGTSRRLAIVWAIVRLRHPLLAAKIVMSPGAYHEIYFSYTPPSSPEEAILEAEENLEVSQTNTTIDEIYDAFTNGPRKLSAAHLSSILISSHEVDASPIQEYDFAFTLTHSLSDGVGIHKLAHLFFTIFGGADTLGGSVRTEAELFGMLEAEWTEQWSTIPPIGVKIIPAATETRLGIPTNKFQEAAWKVDFRSSQDRSVGGQAFPRNSSMTRRNAHSSLIFDTTKTDLVLARCKHHGVTVNNALFVVCNFAWIRTLQRHLKPADMLFSKARPTMIYTAISLRPYIPVQPSKESYVFLSVAYCNIVLPSFIPSTASPSAVFWNRSKSVKAQTRKYLSSSMLVARSQVMSIERGRRARVFAKDDDETLSTAQNASKSQKPISVTQPSPVTSQTAALAQNKDAQSTPPSIALLGISQLGNLDDLYEAEMYPALDLIECQGNTRKGKGGLLVFTHTFRGKLYLMLGWDLPAFRDGVIEEWWNNVGECVEEFLVGEQPTLSKL